MVRSTSPSGPETAPSQPTYRTVQRAALAACMVLAPLTLSLWFALCPQYGDPACPNPASHLSILAAYRAANPLLLQVFLFSNLVIPYVYPLGYIGLGVLAMKRSHWLATLGIACGFVGSIPWGLVADQSFLLNAMAHQGHDALFAALEHVYFSFNPEAYAIFTGWVIGHLLGYVLLGVALLRAQMIPPWAAWLIIVSAPVMGPFAYGTGLGLLQVLGYVLVFVGSIPAAVALLQFRDEDKAAPVRESAEPAPAT
jgi:hypothetical protein